jgi:hypothetical protein
MIVMRPRETYNFRPSTAAKQAQSASFNRSIVTETRADKNQARKLQTKPTRRLPMLAVKIYSKQFLRLASRTIDVRSGAKSRAQLVAEAAARFRVLAVVLLRLDAPPTRYPRQARAGAAAAARLLSLPDVLLRVLLLRPSLLSPQMLPLRLVSLRTLMGPKMEKLRFGDFSRNFSIGNQQADMLSYT